MQPETAAPDISQRLEQIRTELNRNLPAYMRLSELHIKKEEFEKNRLGKVQRFIYVDQNGQKKSSYEDYLKPVIRILQEYTIVKKRKIKPDSRLKEDLGITSLDYISIVYDFEESFRITIPEWREIAELTTVGDIAGYIFHLQNSVKEH